MSFKPTYPVSHREGGIQNQEYGDNVYPGMEAGELHLLGLRCSKIMYRNFYNLLKLEEVFEAAGYCLAHGIVEYWNVGIMIL
jgi:hypothetical protein